jgi:hypothetical protein
MDLLNIQIYDIRRVLLVRCGVKKGANGRCAQCQGRRSGCVVAKIL